LPGGGIQGDDPRLSVERSEAWLAEALTCALLAES
jgi:hypothetical protein